MFIERLDVSGVRCLQPLRLDSLSSVNLIIGPNGSGKTSLLEAIYCLSTARSFRTRVASPLITRQLSEMSLFARLCSDDGVPDISIGLRRTRGGDLTLRVRGSEVKVVSELALVLPVQVIDTEAFELVSGGGKERRQFMDWGVFHVEHSFHGVWLRARQALKQRNALLRRGKISDAEAAFWRQELATASQELHLLRQGYWQSLQQRFTDVLQLLSPGLAVELGYYRGWDNEKDLLDILAQREQQDREAGFTQHGPHRADLRLKVKEGGTAAAHLSRGQLKMVVCALKLAQGELVAAATGKRCIYLLDDLAAELDAGHRQRLLEALMRAGHQVFVTGTEVAPLLESLGSSDNWKMFHVEHGGHIQATEQD